jgi:hypothetical protein
MPNWCNNSITIQGPVDTIRQLWEDAQTAGPEGGFGLLEAMAPIGEWDYGKAVDTWGTKWDISDEGLEFTDNGDGTASIEGWFDSAWAPPVGAYERFLDDMDNCSIEASYYEMGMDFAGFWNNGVDEYCENLHDVWKAEPDNELFQRLNEEYNLVEQFEEWDEEMEES